MRKATLIATAASLAALLMTGGAFAKTFEASYNVALHAKASKASKVVDHLYEGERVKIQTCDVDWCYIGHDGQPGWVPLAALEPVSGGAAPTIVIEGGFGFAHPHKPTGGSGGGSGGGIIVDPVHPKHPGQLGIGNLPTSVYDPGFGPEPVKPPKHFPVGGFGGVSGGLSTGGNGLGTGGNICAVKPQFCTGGGKPFGNGGLSPHL